MIRTFVPTNTVSPGFSVHEPVTGQVSYSTEMSSTGGAGTVTHDIWRTYAEFAVGTYAYTLLPAPAKPRIVERSANLVETAGFTSNWPGVTAPQAATLVEKSR